MSVVENVTMVGGPGGSYREVKAWEVGKFITKLIVFKEENRVRGAYIWMTGQGQYEGATFGEATGDSSATFEFHAGERITSMSLWPGRWGPDNHVRAGHIRFSTSEGRSLDAGPGQWGSETKIDVGSGYLVGVQAYTGADINNWGFVFLKPLLDITLTNVSYPSLTDMGGIVPLTLDSLDEKNGQSSVLNWSLEGSKSRTISWEFSRTEGLTATLGFEVSAGIPEIGLGAKESFQWQVSESSTRTSKHSEETVLKWSTGGVLNPGERVVATALTQEGTLESLPYNGTIVIKTQDGSSYRYPVSGRFSCVTVTKVQVSVDKK